MKEELRKGEKTQQEILEASAQAFIENGYEGASIGDIAAQTGVTQSLIYHYFKDKKTLFRAVKDWVFADFQALEKEENGLARQLAYLSEHPQVMRLILWQQLEDKVEMNFDLPTPPGYNPELFSIFVNSVLYGPFQKNCTVFPVELSSYMENVVTRLNRLYAH